MTFFQKEAHISFALENKCPQGLLTTIVNTYIALYYPKYKYFTKKIRYSCVFPECAYKIQCTLVNKYNLEVIINLFMIKQFP